MTLNCYKFKFSPNFALLSIFGRPLYQGCRALTFALAGLSCCVIIVSRTMGIGTPGHAVFYADRSIYVVSQTTAFFSSPVQTDRRQRCADHHRKFAPRPCRHSESTDDNDLMIV